eukprot:147207-Amphidinium_carterae.1
MELRQLANKKYKELSHYADIQMKRADTITKVNNTKTKGYPTIHLSQILRSLRGYVLMVALPAQHLPNANEFKRALKSEGVLGYNTSLAKLRRNSSKRH